MKSAAQKAYEKVQKSLLMAPGMIEESERRLLFKAAFHCRRPVVEFGAFFGASTLALACGLAAGQANPKPLTCIDAFEVESDHSFHKHVINYAKHCKAEKLLRTDKTKTNWMEITKAVLGKKANKVKLIKGIVDEKFDMTILPETIGLLHLDLPKDAATILPILKGAFPRLTRGSVIAFQDYAYQFSNELIALFELLEQKGMIRPINIAASSMFFEVCTEKMYDIDPENLVQIALSNQHKFIDEATKKYQQYSTSRSQELIALYAAALWAARTDQKPTTFDQQTRGREIIREMMKINKERTIFVLTELLTEKIEGHR